MGSLLIATGVLIYSWISCAHYSFLRENSDSSSDAKTKSPDIILQSLIWPLLKFHPSLTEDLEELEV